MGITNIERKTKTPEEQKKYEEALARQNAIFNNAKNEERLIDEEKKILFEKVLSKRQSEVFVNDLPFKNQNPNALYVSIDKAVEKAYSDLEVVDNTTESAVSTIDLDNETFYTIPYFEYPGPINEKNYAISFHTLDEEIEEKGLKKRIPSGRNLKLDLEHFDNDEYYIDLFDLDEPLINQKRLSGYLRRNELIPGQFYYVSNPETSISFNSELLTKQSLEDLLLTVRK